MRQVRLPVCPVCKEEILLPFSVSGGMESAMTFAHWICTNCGFCIGTDNTRGIHPEEDLHAGFLYKLTARMKELKESFQKGEHLVKPKSKKKSLVDSFKT